MNHPYVFHVNPLIQVICSGFAVGLSLCAFSNTNAIEILRHPDFLSHNIQFRLQTAAQTKHVFCGTVDSVAATHETQSEYF